MANSNTTLQRKQVQFQYGMDIPITFDSPLTPGSLIVVIFEASSHDYAIGVDDPTNGTYQLDKESDAASFMQLSIFSHHNTSSSALTVTAHFNATTYWSVYIYEIWGPPSSSYVDTVVEDHSSTVQTVGITTSTDNTTVIVATKGYIGGTYGTDANMQSDGNMGGYGNLEHRDNIGPAGTFTFNNGGTSPNSAAGNGTILAVAYKTSNTNANEIVQKSPTAAFGASATLTATFPFALTPGNILVAVLGLEAFSGSDSVSIADPTNGTWGIDGQAQNTYGIENKTIVASVYNTATTALTVTVTVGSTAYGYLTVYELKGPPSSNYVDVVATVGGGSTTDPTMTLSALANDSIFSAIATYPGPQAKDPSYAVDYLNKAGNTFYQSGESIDDAGAAGTKTISWGGTMAGAAAYISAVSVAYKTGGGGGGGGSIFNDSVTLTATNNLTDSGPLVMTPSETLAAIAAMSDAGLMTMTPSETLAAIATLSDAGSLVISSSETLAAIAALSDSGLLVVNPTETLGATVGFTENGGFDVNSAVTLPATAGFSDAVNFILGGSLTFAATSTFSDNSILTAIGLLTLLESNSISPLGNLNMATLIALAESNSLSDAGGFTIGSDITLSESSALAASYQNIVNLLISLGASASFTDSVQANLSGNVTLAATALVATAAQAVFASTITLTGNLAVAVNSTLSIITSLVLSSNTHLASSGQTTAFVNIIARIVFRAILRQRYFLYSRNYSFLARA